MAVSMDQLTASLDAHCDVAANPFDTNRPHPRFSEYSSFREPASLMGDQNKRRSEYLERQKRYGSHVSKHSISMFLILLIEIVGLFSKREKLVNLQRRLLEESEVVEVNSTDAADPPDTKENSQSSEAHAVPEFVRNFIHLPKI